MGEADVTLSQTEEKPPDSALVPGEDSVVWSHEVEVCLFHAMIGHKPVGKTANASSDANTSHWNQSETSLTRTLDGPRPHESEILPFPNTEKSFSLPEEIIQEVKGGKLGSEEETKEEFRMEREPPATHEEGSNSSMKMSERMSGIREKEKERDKEKGGGEGGVAGGAGGGGAKEAEKRKRSRATEKLLSSSNPASPGGAKRRRT
ncbi:hypothetical protein CCH79_00020269 [Gambusia affinis]|uniref:Uncharacterized protein n=1 Tax=Gambusia affinis TaxID=33528 RepID=A0A315W3K7_GAMAF|nr:hypothetical protein CCH79_00020269 [Gambusia affinis]